MMRSLDRVLSDQSFDADDESGLRFSLYLKLKILEDSKNQPGKLKFLLLRKFDEVVICTLTTLNRLNFFVTTLK